MDGLVASASASASAAAATGVVRTGACLRSPTTHRQVGMPRRSTVPPSHSPEGSLDLMAHQSRANHPPATNVAALRTVNINDRDTHQHDRAKN